MDIPGSSGKRRRIESPEKTQEPSALPFGASKNDAASQTNLKRRKPPIGAPAPRGSGRLAVAESAPGMAAFEAMEPAADWLAIEDVDFLLDAKAAHETVDADRMPAWDGAESPVDWEALMVESFTFDLPEAQSVSEQGAPAGLHGDAVRPPILPTSRDVGSFGGPLEASSVEPEPVVTSSAPPAASTQLPLTRYDDATQKFLETQPLRSPGNTNLSDEGKLMVDRRTNACPPDSQTVLALHMMLPVDTVYAHVTSTLGEKPRQTALVGTSGRYTSVAKKEMAARSKLHHSNADIDNYFGASQATVRLALLGVAEAERTGNAQRFDESKHLRSPGGTTPSAEGRIVIDRRTGADPPESQTSIADDLILPVAAVRRYIKESLGSAQRASSFSSVSRRYRQEAIADMHERARLGHSRADIANWHGTTTGTLILHEVREASAASRAAQPRRVTAGPSQTAAEPDDRDRH